MSEGKAVKYMPYFGGLLTGGVTALLFQPLEVIKTRLQKHGSDSPSTEAVPRSRSRLLHEAKLVYRSDGLPGFFRGLVPSLLRAVPGTGIYVAAYHFTRQYFDQPGTHKLSDRDALFLGATCRGASGFVTFPFTVIKTRFESGMFNYPSVWAALKDLFRTEGVIGLWRGYIPTLARDAPYAGIYMMCYHRMRRTVIAPEEEISASMNFTLAATAGLLTSLVTHPPDVIRARMQLHVDLYKGSVLKASQGIFRDSGVSGFLAGFVPRSARKALAAAVTWGFYEEIAKLSSEFDKRELAEGD